MDAAPPDDRALNGARIVLNPITGLTAEQSEQLKRRWSAVSRGRRGTAVPQSPLDHRSA